MGWVWSRALSRYDSREGWAIVHGVDVVFYCGREVGVEARAWARCGVPWALALLVSVRDVRVHGVGVVQVFPWGGGVEQGVPAVVHGWLGGRDCGRLVGFQVSS